MSPTRSEVEAGDNPEISRVQNAYLGWLVKELPGPQQIPPPRVIFEAGWRAAEREMATHEADGGMTADLKIATLTAALEQCEGALRDRDRAFDAMNEQLEQTSAALEAHRALLRRIEWIVRDAPTSVNLCPCCGCYPGKGHAGDCSLAALLGGQ